MKMVRDWHDWPNGLNANNITKRNQPTNQPFDIMMIMIIILKLCFLFFSFDNSSVIDVIYWIVDMLTSIQPITLNW